MTPAEFRELFPALSSTVWLDTPGSPPGAQPVVRALQEAITRWSTGQYDRSVAASVPPGRVLAEQEFRSNLFPWMARHEVVTVPTRDGVTCVDNLAAAVDERTVLLAVSEVTSREGQRLDLAALRAATDRVGARLFVNLTQSLGTLHIDAHALRPDYLAVHGYK